MDPVIQEKEVRLELLMPIMQEHLAAGRIVRFGPKGTSMLPMLRQGIDTVEISPVPATLKKYDLPLYRRESGQFVLHRIVTVGDTYTCIGDNQFAFETGVKHSQMLALVTAFYRGDKRYSVNAWHYRLYCRLWHYSRPARHLWLLGISWLKNRLK